MHIILDNAKRYKVMGNVEKPKGYFYDDIVGYWRNELDGKAYVKSINYSSAVSKKHDIETGEDEKGE